MSILTELRRRLAVPLARLTDQTDEYLDLVRQSQDPKFGDYQANFAMPLGKQLGRAPREVAAEIVGQIDLGDFCDSVDLAGPGFINARLSDAWIVLQLRRAVADERVGVPAVDRPRTYDIIDYSAPNVAKPMHVGHIRSTVIGESLCRTLRFLGHRVTSDNHIGDWGTQFGMILYGWRHFRDEAAYRRAPVDELARLYRLVRQLMDYHEGRAKLPKLRERLAQQESALADERRRAASSPDKKAQKALRRFEAEVGELGEEVDALAAKLKAVEDDPVLARLAAADPAIERAVLAETAKLHAGDAENVKLWREFVPHCLAEIQRVYDRLGVKFDHTLGESFYNDRLGRVVKDLLARGIARESDGAIGVFLPDQDVPMLVRKQDESLYATTDLATIEYRMETWRPDAILYVVDHRQSMHFEHLFATARLLGYRGVELRRAWSFGTVLGSDGRPFKTRSGETVGLESLLDEAVRRAGEIVAAGDDAKPDGPELSPAERARIAERVGIAALKYADLAQNRTSDYVFSYDKMLAMNGNTATYMQYAYARVRSIFARGGVDVESLRASGAEILLATPAERALGLAILQFGEAIDLAVLDDRPNHLTGYLFDLAGRYSTFFEQCPVLKADSDALRQSRLLLCDLTARVIHKGLELLGIEVVEKM